MSARGFTLVEVVVVILLMGIVGALAVPSLPGLGRGAPEETTRAVMGVLRGARRTAVESGRSVRVILDPSGARYWVETDFGDDRWSRSAGVIPVSPGVSLKSSEPRPEYTFTPSGPGYGDTLFIHGPTPAVVTVDIWTGEPRAMPR